MKERSEKAESALKEYKDATEIKINKHTKKLQLILNERDALRAEKLALETERGTLEKSKLRPFFCQ
jgi:hypothetical protein